MSALRVVFRGSRKTIEAEGIVDRLRDDYSMWIHRIILFARETGPFPVVLGCVYLDGSATLSEQDCAGQPPLRTETLLGAALASPASANQNTNLTGDRGLKTQSIFA